MELLWAISELRSPLGDKLVQLITYLGEELFLISVICALYWCFNKKLATQIGFTFITSGMLVQTLKITFRIPRPWVLDPNFQPVESAIEAATGYSFPSGHTQSATSLFAPLACNAKRMFAKAGYVLCFLLVAFSRMYLGVHTLKDVSVAILLTFTLALFIHKYQDSLFDRKNTKRICLLLLGAAIAICLYSPLLHSFGVIEAKYVDDCYKIAGAAFGFAAGWYLERTRLNFSPSECKSSKRKVLRFTLGILSTAVLYVVPKYLFTGIAIWKMIRYALVIFWVIYAYPYLFTKYKI